MKKKKVLKKKLEDFLKDESGETSKDKVLKIGLGTISALGIMAAFSSDVSVAHSNVNTTVHTNYIDPPPGAGTNTGGSICFDSHSNYNTHTNHSSY